MTVRTRFAPSPTGFLHIGGVRTALFNWIYAKQHGGQFVLRIDDTDQQRNVEAALKPILDGFRWLGIDWDEGPEVEGPYGPYFQSQRSERYESAVETLLEKGLAYRDFAKPEEVQSERETAEKAKVEFIYSRSWMAESEEQAVAFQAEGRQCVVRLKMPREGQCRFTDLVREDVTFDWAREQDHVIQRADGTCLYHLANVVDDHDLKITHVIRAIEHLPNTPRQIFIAQGLGYELPQYAHLPFVAEPGSKNKLSKRKIEKYLKNREFKKLYDSGEKIAHRIGMEVAPDTFNPVLVDFYEAIGYLPDAIVNYLLLLGWSLDDKTEDFSRDEMLKHFSLERVVKSPASFDPAKLQAFQERRMQQVELTEKTTACLPFLQRAGYLPAEPSTAEVDRVKKIVAAAGDRIKAFGDVLEFDDFFVADEDLTLDAKAMEKRLRKPEDAVALLNKFKSALADSHDFSAATLDKLLHDFVESEGIKIGQIVHALRVGVTGRAVGFGVFETLEILGQDRCLKRIEYILSKLG